MSIAMKGGRWFSNQENQDIILQARVEKAYAVESALLKICVETQKAWESAKEDRVIAQRARYEMKKKNDPEEIVWKITGENTAS